jgi:hypothetical protein
MPGLVTINLEKQQAILAKKAKDARIEEGKKARVTCQAVLELVAGFNLESNLTSEQIDSMVATFGAPLQALQLNRPTMAKGLIQAIVPSGVVTQELLDECLELLADY